MGRFEHFSDEERSVLMSTIKSSGTKAEVLLGKYLHASGMRFRKNVKGLPGKPDFAIKRYKLAIFVDGVFWHGKDWDVRKKKLKKNKQFWIDKIEKNMARDKKVNQELIELGYTVLRFWDQEVLKSGKEVSRKIFATLTKLKKSA